MKVLDGLLTTVGKGARVGAIAGVATAAILMSLSAIRPFPVPIDRMIDHLTFRLCPLYVLGFSSSVKNWPELIAIVLLSNALLYGALFAAAAGVVQFIRRITG